ncbi:LysR family transcriptional regulator [Phaeovulum sp. NW3]|uniref:LysR family transcriptional regulator n=1 Tax=Phaeovulum sp. NW3 TaxID=2934933 RepID=UPI0024C28335|nr:LysR family transcriptional regulator [Phaeovulum sp. NW3]MCL7464880.1 LysR family transcriptional regulator [Phaeovulum sp. NW3]
MKPLPSPDPIRALTLPRLRALLAVVEAGSYSAAARLLGLSHSAVAQQIRDLEAAFEVHLFDRVNGSLRATPLCSELCDIGQRIQEAERDALRVLGRRTGAGAHLLRVGLGNSMPGIAIIGELVTDHPSASVVVQTGSHRSILGALLRREVDVAVLPDLPPDARFRRAPVLTQEVVAIVSADHPLASQARVSLARLVQEPLIFRSAGSSTQKVVDRALRLAGLSAQPRLVADTRDGVYEAVATGIGVGFMWRHGTYRADAVRRLEVAEMRAPVEEVVFALSDERGPLVEMFFHAAERLRLAGAEKES